MFLRKCDNFPELISFLKLDYANNLYFFTYLNNIGDSDIEFLIVKQEDKIVLALLLTPVHCSISTLNINYIYLIADQLPPINSIHIVGRSDYIEPLLTTIKGPSRNKHFYTLCEFTEAKKLDHITPTALKASGSNLGSLIEFYNSNEMLMGADTRLPAILSWGTVYYVPVDHKIVSCALTTTETNDVAMIGAVYTIPEYRNNKYAKACLSSICKELLSNNKRPYLFYESDHAMLNRLYKSLGFNECHKWLLATRKWASQPDKGTVLLSYFNQDSI